MTSARSMLLVALLATPAGCPPRLDPPTALVSAAPETQVWGVAPFRNESGASIVDAPRLADAFMAEAQHAEGIDVVPVNRVIGAMRAAGMEHVAAPGDALTLMNVLDLDALVVGTITAYDPYRPMKLGLAVQLYARERSIAGGGLDPRVLTRSIRGHAAPGELGPPGPVAQAAGVFDAGNHGTLARLEEYAAGRADPETAFRTEIYLVSMDSYARFVCHRLLSDLLRQEANRHPPLVEASE